MATVRRQTVNFDDIIVAELLLEEAETISARVSAIAMGATTAEPGEDSATLTAYAASLFRDAAKLCNTIDPVASRRWLALAEPRRQEYLQRARSAFADFLRTRGA